MRKLLTLTCCVGLASLVGAAQNNNQNNNQQYKKKGGNAQAQQTVAPTGGGKAYGNKAYGNKAYKTGPNQTFQQSNTGGNKFNTNKTKFQSQSNLNSSKSNKFKTNGQTGGQPGTSGNAASTKFNKTKFGAQGTATGGGNAKFQKQKFNLQTNNKQVVINKYKTVNFNQNYKIAGAYNWKGPKYAVFVNYHPLWQSQWWWTSHYNHIVFIYGGWYYWNANYWYPAWGYAPDSVYAYDGPIYASSPDYDPAQVIANVQSALQQQGYYQGDIDGVLGPQTRAALAEYQSAQGIEPTGLVDEPTLETLGMS